MLLYVFISLPVQIWHCHAPENNTEAEKPVFAVEVFTNHFYLVAEKDDCSICSHHYSGYYNDALLAKQLVNKGFKEFESFYFPARSEAAYLYSSNKSPPAA